MWEPSKLLRNAFIIILLLFWSVCLYSGNYFLIPFPAPQSAPDPAGDGEQPEAGSMHVQLKQALVGVAATRLREDDEEVWVGDEDDDDGNR